MRSIGELATLLGTSAATVRRLLETQLTAHVVRLACEVDLGLLGITSEALLWIATGRVRLTDPFAAP